MKTIFSAVLIVALQLPMTVIAQDDVRLIVTKKTSAMAKGNSPSVTSEALTVSENEVDGVIEALQGEQDVVAVERDIKVYQIGQPRQLQPSSVHAVAAKNSSANTEVPNDEYFEYQPYWLPRSDKDKTGNNILTAYNLGAPKSRPRVAVMDGGFMLEGQFEDLNPALNYSFVNNEHSNYGDPAWNDESELYCENGHGAGVLSVINATANNEIDIAGIIDTETYMLQVMRCGNGMMYDSANALRWAAGGTVDGLPTLNDDQIVKVATFSLGAEATCPSFMQSAIDYAVSKGVTVFVAAGNDTMSADRFSPANCDNVVVTAALDYMTGDLADFSNYGDAIDIASQGTEIGALANMENSNIAVWSGTSFATPITSGSFALAKAHAPSIDNDTLIYLMEVTTGSLAEQLDCVQLGCGVGILDTGRFVSLAKHMEEGSLISVKHALDETALCDQNAYLMNDGVKARLCDSYKLTIDIDSFAFNDADSVSFNLYQWDDSESFNPVVMNPIHTASQAEFMLSGLNLNLNTAVMVCVNGRCDEKLIFPIKLPDNIRTEQCPI